MNPNSNDSIPITDFYGESTTWSAADSLYCERLILRSAMYDWQIKPHRHEKLVQLFYVEEGSGLAEVDNQRFQLSSGNLLIVPQNCVHTFLWEEGSNGYVLFVARPLLAKMEQVLGGLPWAHQNGQLLHITDQVTLVESLLSTLCTESGSRLPQREIFMENLALSLFMCLNRKMRAKVLTEVVEADKSQRHLDKFSRLLEANYTTEHTVDWYAANIGITAAHLNHLCKTRLEQSALSVIHERQLAEAKRSLIYTGKAASQVAEELGFSDPAYFSRFFKRLTGVSPGKFRQDR